MPELSRFYGIVIAMYYNDHDPPHFHARYAGRAAKFGLDPLAQIDGDVPARVRSLVLEWAALHREELRANWARRAARESMQPIDPLE